MELTLVMFKANGERRDYVVGHTHYTIGRSTECEMQIPLPMVSRRHCEFLLEDDRVAVRDLGSANGTFINETRVLERALKPGDRLSVGPVIFTVVVDGKPASINPVRTVIMETASGGQSAAKSSVGSGTGIIALAESGSGELKMDDSMAAIQESKRQKT